MRRKAAEVYEIAEEEEIKEAEEKQRALFIGFKKKTF